MHARSDGAACWETVSPSFEISDKGSKEGRRDRTREEKEVERRESRGRWIFFTEMPLRLDRSATGKCGRSGKGWLSGMDLGILRLGLEMGETLALDFGGGEAGEDLGGVAETWEPSESESESMVTSIIMA